MTGNCSANCPPQIIRRRRRMKLKKHIHLQSPAHRARCAQRHLNLGPQLWYIPDPQYTSSLLFCKPTHIPICQVQLRLQIRSKFHPWRWFDCILPTTTSGQQISFDSFGFIGLSLSSVTTQSAHQLIGLVCRLYLPPLAFRCWMICR
jgi:hypothetical protein